MKTLKMSFTTMTAIILVLSFLTISATAQTGTGSIASDLKKLGRTSPALGVQPQSAGDTSITVREPALIDTTTKGSAQGISVSTSDDLSAVVYNDGGERGSNGVYVIVSDGRGIVWSTPVQVDSDGSGAPKFIQSNSIIVKDNSIYVAWKDTRFSAVRPDLFFNVSHDGGETWYGEELIDNAYSPGDVLGNSAAVRDWRMLVTSDPEGGDDHVFILFTVEPDKYVPLPDGNLAAEELYLVTSHDGGEYFMPPVHVPQEIDPGAADIDMIAIAGEGTQISIAWQDDRSVPPFNDIWFQHSHDGGITWNQTDTALKTIPAGTTDASGSISLVQTGTTVIAAWQENREHSSNEELRVNVSVDMGFSWLSNDMQIGGYMAGEHDVDSASLWVPEAPRTIFPVIRSVTPMITWTDNRTGSDEVYVAISGDGGFSWSETRISEGGGRDPSFMGGDKSAGLAWIEDDPTGNAAASAFSSRSGSRWSSGFDYAHLPGHQITSIESAFNSLYGNFICIFLASDRRIEDTSFVNRVYAGGYRPQTCSAVVENLASGMSVRFDVSHWPETKPWIENDLYFGVLISGGKGGATLPPADGRNTGLLPDLFLARSLTFIPGALSGNISNSSGYTISNPIPDSAQLPRGLVLHYAAVGYNPFRTPTGYGYITDVGELTLDTLGSASD